MEKPLKDQRQARQVRIEIDDTVADGTYVNLAFISSNNAEFIFDFARFLPGNTRGKVVTRVVMNPIHTKGFLKSLTESVDTFEGKFGTITAEVVQKNIGFDITADDAGEN